MTNPEFVTLPMPSVEPNNAIVAFLEMFAENLRAREHDSCNGESLLADLIGMNTLEVLYRCTCGYHWRAFLDAKLVLHQILESIVK